MSPASSLAKPLARPITQCPYCEHVSPAESKFCNECGAALHLMPCPHCGAVNDITVATACYRCHGELRSIPSAALAASATTPAGTAHAESTSAQSDASPYVMPEPPTRRRPYTLVVAIMLIAFAAAGYYAVRQRSALNVRESARTEMESRGTPVDTNTNAGAGNIVKAPADAVPNPVPATAVVPVEVKTARPGAEPPRDATTAPAPIATTATRSGAARSVAAREAIESPPPASVAPELARARADAAKGLDQQIPIIATCSDAVAALGLCKSEPTTRRQ